VEPPGLWAGDGAAALGLAGAVTGEGQAAVFAGVGDLDGVLDLIASAS
jgi:hypothetical protein